MRSYGKLESAFWQNPKIHKLSDSAKLLLIYLFSCPHGNLVGCFVLPVGYVLADLGWTSERVTEHVTELVTKGFIEREETINLIRIIGWFDHNTIENDNIAKSAFKIIKALPECQAKSNLIKDIFVLSNKFLNKYVNELPNSLANPLPNMEMEPEMEPEPTAAREVGFFQKCFDHATKLFPELTAANNSMFHAWEAAGYDFEKHVKPAMDAAKAKGAAPRSFNFFNGAIEDSAKTKLKPAPAKPEPIILTPEQIEANKAFKQKMGMYA